MKTAISLSIGDRTCPLEADFQGSVDRSHSLVGKTIEVSPIAGGDLKGESEKKARVTGVYLRFGTVVGFEVEIGGDTYYGTTKDFYVDREYLEDIQPPTATSAGLREGLAHWATQRDYWGAQTSGLEAFCFDLASATPQAMTECFPWGWRFLVPAPMPGDRAIVDCRAVRHDNLWSLSTLVYPNRAAVDPVPPLIEDHWARVFTWTHNIGLGMIPHGFPWDAAVRNLQVRAKATAQVLRPLVERTLADCVRAKAELTGTSPYLPPGSVTAAFSDVRLKAATVGLLEPPTDRRPYSVMSISPSVVRKEGYLQQVVLHECIHVVVGSTGGDPHNEEFLALSAKMGLDPENTD